MATMKELLIRYNEIAAQVGLPPRKAFKTKADAESQVAHAEALAAETPRGGGGRKANFDYEPNPAGVKEARPNTKRARVVEMLREGATLQAVQDEIGWDRHTAIQGVKLVAVKLGWGMRQDARTEVITIFEADKA